MLRNHVHHPRGQPRIRDDAHPFGLRRRVELLLLLHDFGVAAQVGKVHPHLDRQRGQRGIEVVWNGAHDGVAAGIESAHRVGIPYIEREHLQARTVERGQEGGQMVNAKIGQQDLRDRGIVQQIKGAGGAL